MKIQLMFAVLLSAATATACGDGGANTENIEENTAPPVATAPAPDELVAEGPGAPAPASRRDGSAVRDNRTGSSGARPTTGSDLRGATPDASRPARSAATRPEGRAPQFREVTVPAGTSLPLELQTALSSETAQIETPVRARLRSAVVVDGYTVLPAGAVLAGNVTDVDRAGRVQGRARLAFRFTEALYDGQTEDVRTNPITFEGEATKGEDATKIGGGAVGGAIIGGILGGADGAAKGAAIGGAAGTGVVLATGGRAVKGPAGTDIAATVATPFTIRARVN